MSKKILCGLDPNVVSEERKNQVKKLAPEKEILISKKPEEIEPYLDSVEIAVGDVPRDLLAKAPNLKWFQQWGAGADWLMKYPDIKGQKFIITNASGVHAIPISEHMLAFMFCFARGFHRAILSQQDRIWEPTRTQPVFELRGKTVVVIGVGAIGSEFARLCTNLGMNIVGVRRNPDLPHPSIERMVGTSQLRAVVPEADFLAITAPHTPETTHMIGREEINLMKPSAILINIGRGKTIDEQALIEALQNEKIRGAGLDVFEEEPLPEDSPLWDLENVIVTPHYSGLTPEYNNRAWNIFIDNLERYVAGKELNNIVDTELGY